MPVITSELGKDAEYAIIGEMHYFPAIQNLEHCIAKHAGKSEAEMKLSDAVELFAVKYIAKQARFCFEQELQAINRCRDRVDRIYMEGRRSHLNYHPAELEESFKGKEVVWLDEGLRESEKTSALHQAAWRNGPLYNIDQRAFGSWHFYNNYLQGKRENGWAEKMSEKGGIAIMGSYHAERMARKLAKHGKKADVVMDLAETRRPYEINAGSRQLLEEAKETLAENVKAHWPVCTPKIERFFSALPQPKAEAEPKAFRAKGVVIGI